MGHRSDPEFLVLHTLRLKGFAQPDAVATTTGLDEADIATTLDKAAGAGHAQKREGRITGWALTPAGRSHHAALLQDEVSTAGCRDKVDAAYRRFLEINGQLLGVCTDWQMRKGPTGDQVLNDHTDAGYDAAVVKRLRAIDDAVQPVCADLADVLDRFANYGPRLAHAIDRVEAGEVEYA